MQGQESHEKRKKCSPLNAETHSCHVSGLVSLKPHFGEKIHILCSCSTSSWSSSAKRRRNLGLAMGHLAGGPRWGRVSTCLLTSQRQGWGVVAEVTPHLLAQLSASYWGPINPFGHQGAESGMGLNLRLAGPLLGLCNDDYAEQPKLCAASICA